MTQDEEPHWRSFQGLAGVQASSEDPAYPVAGPTASPPENDWRAAQPGEQWLQVVFAEPQSVRRVRLVFREPHRSRTQEFTLRSWSTDDVIPREILRQQFTFSPGTIQQIEDYRLELSRVVRLELRIVPDISGASDAVASLSELRIG